MKSCEIKLVLNVWKRKKKEKSSPDLHPGVREPLGSGSELEPDQHQCSACWSLVQQYSHKQVDEAALRVLPTPRNPVNYMLRCNSWLTGARTQVFEGVCVFCIQREDEARAHTHTFTHTRTHTSSRSAAARSSAGNRAIRSRTGEYEGFSSSSSSSLLPLFLLLLLLPTLNPPMPVGLHNPSSQQDLESPAPETGREWFQNKSRMKHKCQAKMCENYIFWMCIFLQIKRPWQ